MLTKYCKILEAWYEIDTCFKLEFFKSSQGIQWKIAQTTVSSAVSASPASQPYQWISIDVDDKTSSSCATTFEIRMLFHEEFFDKPYGEVNTIIYNYGQKLIDLLKNKCQIILFACFIYWKFQHQQSNFWAQYILHFFILVFCHLNKNKQNNLELWKVYIKFCLFWFFEV